MGNLTLVTGGVRSGKSSWTLKQAGLLSAAHKIFIATAEPFDDEMRARISDHQIERGKEWETVEAPLDLPGAVRALGNDTTAIIDCCTVWLGNIWHRTSGDDQKMMDAVDDLLTALREFKERSGGTLYMVTNEVGWGIVPPEPDTRRYRDVIGKLNQLVASEADEVYMCVAGIAVSIKKSHSRSI